MTITEGFVLRGHEPADSGGDRVTVIVPAPELDADTTPELHAHLMSLLDRGGVSTVILDLSRVEFLSSAGLSALVDASARAEAEGVTLCLSGCSRPVRRVLWVTRLSGRFPVYTCLEDALAATG